MWAVGHVKFSERALGEEKLRVKQRKPVVAHGRRTGDRKGWHRRSDEVAAGTLREALTCEMG